MTDEEKKIRADTKAALINEFNRVKLIS